MSRQSPEGTRRPLAGKRELAVLAAIVLVCLGVLLARSFGGRVGASAVIFLEGEAIRRVELYPEDDYRIDLEPEYGVPVSFEVKGGQIRFVDVTCPDHICERAGFLSLTGQTASCMPNRVTLLVEAGEFDGNS